MTPSSELLSLRGVHCGYGDISILHGVDLDVAPGTLTAIVGRNGAGKTTLLRAISGLNKITAGTITFAGADIAGLPPYVRAAKGIAFVQEGKRIFRGLSVEDNLRIGAHGLRLSRVALRERQGEAYERFPMLGQRRRIEAAALSGGQQQMLAIAQAMMCRPTLLLLDEPSAGLAPKLVAQVFETIESLRAEHMTILLVEQAVDYALSVADNACVLDLGLVAIRGYPGEAGFRRRVEDIYFARVPGDVADPPQQLPATPGDDKPI